MSPTTTITELISQLHSATDKENVLVMREFCNALENLKTTQYRNSRAVGAALLDNNELKAMLAAVGAMLTMHGGTAYPIHQERIHIKFHSLSF